MNIIEETSGIDGIEATCATLDVCRATFCRRRRPPVFSPVRRTKPTRALSPEERAATLAVLHEDRRMVAPREGATLAERVIGETCARQGIERGQPTIHADPGSSMRSKLVAQLLADLGCAFRPS
jgi:hypothetical protein